LGGQTPPPPPQRDPQGILSRVSPTRLDLDPERKRERERERPELSLPLGCLTRTRLESSPLLASVHSAGLHHAGCQGKIVLSVTLALCPAGCTRGRNGGITSLNATIPIGSLAPWKGPMFGTVIQDRNLWLGKSLQPCWVMLNGILSCNLIPLTAESRTNSTFTWKTVLSPVPSFAMEKWLGP
jgi:hypothetical protein